MKKQIDPINRLVSIDLGSPRKAIKSLQFPAVFAAVFAAVFLMLSCGGTAPDIVELRWRLNVQFTPRSSDNLTERNTLGYETLSMFLRPADDDGLEDLDSIYLLNPKHDLFWALDSSQWSSSTSANIFWIGSNQFSSGYLAKLPRGEYIVELYDKAGERDQRRFDLQAPDTRGLSALVTVPKIGDELLFLLPGNVSLYAIIGYNVTNNILFTDANYQSIISLKELKIRNDELDKVILSFEFPDSHIGVIIGPYMVPRVSSKILEEPLDSAAEVEGESMREETAPLQGEIDIYIPTKEEISLGASQEALDQEAQELPP